MQILFKRSIACVLVLVALAAILFLPLNSLAHHGWGWATDEEFEITGKIVGVRLGNPHGEITLEVSGENWIAEVGQPWSNERAGLTAELLSVGRMVTIHGHRSAKKDENLIKAERVVIDGRDYNLYPDRAS